MGFSKHQNIIEECFPSVKIQSFNPIITGWGNLVFEVNNELIFRFPQGKDNESQLKKEILLLTELSKALPLAIPFPEFVWNGDGKHRKFMGYRKITGVPLRKKFLKISQIKSIAKELSDFLNQLHLFPVQKALELNVLCRNGVRWKQSLEDLFIEVKNRVFPLVSQTTQAKLTVFWEEFLDRGECFQFEPVLLHSDLSIDNIMFDPEKKIISGIIDWSDAIIGDPAYDFRDLLRCYDKFFFGLVMNGYKRKVDETFFERVVFYSKLNPFKDILHGLDINNDFWVERGRRQLLLNYSLYEQSTRIILGQWRKMIRNKFRELKLSILTRAPDK